MMKRQRSAEQIETRVYAYGCAVPSAGWEACLREQARQWDFWDALVRIDHDIESRELAIARQDAAVGPAARAVDAVTAQLERALAERRAARQAARSRVPTPDLDRQIGEMAEARRSARRAYWAALSAWRTTHHETVQRLWEERKQAIVQLRRKSGCYWGNSNRVLDSYERARIAGRKIGRRVQRMDARRRDGVLTVQIQRSRSGLGAAPDELDGTAVGSLSLTPSASGPGTHVLRMRIDAAGTMLRCPVWMHRPLPVGRIKSVQWTWQRGEAQWRYQLALTVTRPQPESTRHPSTRAAALDLGYRQVDAGLLVGTLVDSDGTIRRFHVPSVWVQSWESCRQDDAETNGDDRLERALANRRARLCRHRRELYRLWAKELCSTYAVLVLEDWDLSRIATVRAREEDADPQAVPAVRSQRHMVALSEWRLAIEHAAAKTGTRIVWGEGAYTTLTCHRCGHVQHRQEKRVAQVWRCQGCGLTWDQDVNAAMNLLAALTRERSSGGEDPVTRFRQDRPIASPRSATRSQLRTDSHCHPAVP